MHGPNSCKRPHHPTQQPTVSMDTPWCCLHDYQAACTAAYNSVLLQQLHVRTCTQLHVLCPDTPGCCLQDYQAPCTAATAGSLNLPDNTLPLNHCLCRCCNCTACITTLCHFGACACTTKHIRVMQHRCGSPTRNTTHCHLDTTPLLQIEHMLLKLLCCAGVMQASKLMLTETRRCHSCCCAPVHNCIQGILLSRELLLLHVLEGHEASIES
jgi:hypothetical protein